jgi:hypothetical protein
MGTSSPTGHHDHVSAHSLGEFYTIHHKCFTKLTIGRVRLSSERDTGKASRARCKIGRQDYRKRNMLRVSPGSVLVEGTDGLRDISNIVIRQRKIERQHQATLEQQFGSR